MTLQQIHYALTVMEEGSMNKAAEKLFVSQPTLTSAIRELERDANITIFNRTSHGVILTNEGREFLMYARQVYQQYEMLQDRYSVKGNIRKRFCVSTQHYSFVVKAFVETVKKYDTASYDFAIKETRTLDVIEETGNSSSEVGVLYVSEYNRKYISRLLSERNLEFHPLSTCSAYVYLYKEHPLAGRKSIRFEELLEYPFMSFEQSDKGAMYLSEEILVENQYPRTIKVNDRATMFNLLRGLNGYTLCPGIISAELNGDDYLGVPYEADESNPNAVMEMGYIVRRNTILTEVGRDFINELENYFREHPVSGEQEQ